MRDLTLAVDAGSITAILGPNGAGKTTLLRILATTVSPDRGTVHILGSDVVRHAYRVRCSVGFVLGDERSFFWRLTARQNLRFFATLHDLDGRSSRARIEEVATTLDIGGELDKPFRDLSTGMRQRLGLARSLLHDPKVLLIDEPTRALDPGAAERCRRLIRETLVDGLHKTVLLATHNVEEARAIADRAALLKAGSIHVEGPTAEALREVPAVFELGER